MVWEWIRFITAAGLLLLGMFFEILAVFGVQKFKKALNRMHAAAIGDTLGVLFIFLGLMVMRGFTMDSLKLFLVILFFWMASPVSGHMISRLEAMTNQNLGEIHVIHMGEAAGSGAEGSSVAGEDARMQPGPEGKPVVNAETRPCAEGDTAAGEDAGMQPGPEGKPVVNAETRPCAEGKPAANAETQSCVEEKPAANAQTQPCAEGDPAVNAETWPCAEGEPAANTEARPCAEGESAANVQTQPCAEGESDANAEIRPCAEKRSDMEIQSVGQKETPTEISARSGKGDVR